MPIAQELQPSGFIVTESPLRSVSTWRCSVHRRKLGAKRIDEGTRDACPLHHPHRAPALQLAGNALPYLFPIISYCLHSAGFPETDSGVLFIMDKILGLEEWHW